MIKKILAIVFACISLVANIYFIIRCFYTQNMHKYISAFLLICFFVIMCIITIKMCISFKKEDKNVSIGVFAILFVNIISGILYLCWEPDVSKLRFRRFDVSTLDEDNKMRVYNKSKEYIEKGDRESLILAKRLLGRLGNFLDSKQLIKECEKEIKKYNRSSTLKILLINGIILGCVLLIVGTIIINNNISHSLVFETNGGTKIETVKYGKGEKLSLPENPTKEGYIFVGWNKELPEKMPARKVVLKAKWIKTGEVFEEDGKKYLYFGEYAQDLVKNQNIIEVLEDENKVKYKREVYYEYNGRRYKEVNDSYYLVSPLRWQIIEEDDNSYKLICDVAITTLKEAVDPLDYLNNEFINCYISEEEQDRIIPYSDDEIITILHVLPSGANPKKYPYMHARLTDYAYSLHIDCNDKYADWYVGYNKKLSSGLYEVVDYRGYLSHETNLRYYVGLRPVVTITK